MSHFQGFSANIGVIYFGGEVDENDNLYCRWRWQTDRIRVICNNSENRETAYIHYLAIWR